MKPFDAYTTYLAVKNHFERDGYDYFKYRGKVPAKVESFYARKDRYFFEKLARRTDLLDFLVANFVSGSSHYSRELTHEEAERTYRDWLKRTQSLSYQFENDLGAIEDLKEALAVRDGQHPQLLKLFMREKVSPETMVILDTYIGFLESWDNKLQDKIVWPSIKKKLVKYRPFLKFDKQKFKDVIVKRYAK